MATILFRETVQVGSAIALLGVWLGLPLPVLASDRCPPAQSSRPWQKPATSSAARATAGPAGQAAVDYGDYRQALDPSAAGWPVLAHWCVWVEPTRLEGPAARFEQRWLMAVESALGQWQGHLSLQRVNDPARAQVLVRRRRPPLISLEPGQRRASHGRASLTLQETERQGVWRLEPRVEVLISPDQRREATEATALHELGHAFGLWGHSPEASDAMAAVPGAVPVLQLSARDLATLRWLYAQPSRFGVPQPENELETGPSEQGSAGTSVVGQDGS